MSGGLTRRRALARGLAALLVPALGRAQGDGAAVQPFRWQASEAALQDLQRRLAQTRWPEDATAPGWAQGPPVDALKALVQHWQHGYDWRKTEAQLAGWPQFKTAIDGLGIHFLHVRSPHANATPLLMTHGWPSTVLLFADVIGPLTDPVRHGGSPRDAFHLVLPSLPGFAFSDKPAGPGWNAERTARAWAVLMQRLGYDRYVAQGGDWGAYITTALAQQHAPGLRAIHLNFALTLPDVIPKRLKPDQQRAVDAMTAYREKGSAYFQLQATRPQTLGYALTDSPVGQAAWIYDIFASGTGQQAPERVLPLDRMLDEITLYWLTGTASSSARFYLEQARLLGKRNNPGRVDLPVGVSVFPNDLPPARSWAPQVYPRLFYWNELQRGGHFAQMEVPELFVEELRKCFARLRG